MNITRPTIALAMALSMCASAYAQNTLKETVGKYFLIGTAMNVDQVAGRNAKAEKAVRENFNAIVAENCMKAEVVQPEEGVFKWTDADSFVAYGEKNNLAMTGHCLVWHSQAPKWFFTDKNGNDVTRPVMIERMRKHIFAVAGRYRGRLKGWDVVNEAFEDDGTMRKSKFYQLIGPDYIELAFRFAHEADPDAELYYNDYSMSKPAKRDAVCRLVRSLQAKGIRIDAVGMQSHNGTNYPDLTDYEKSIEAFAACGVKVMITELDLNMLPNPDKSGGAEISLNYEYDKKLNPYAKGLDKAAQKLFDQRYMDFFSIYYKHRKDISRVTLWGVGDGDSWLNDWPVKGRTNYGLLFDRQYKAKPVVKQITELYK